MGNSISITSSCFHPKPCPNTAKLIFHDGNTRILTTGRGGRRRRLAGEIMFEFPDCMVCHADSFFIGHPIPSLSINDELMNGQTYFVLPLDYVPPGGLLSASSLAALGSQTCPNRAPVNFKDSPFEHVKGKDGRLLIKVVPEFITKLITRGHVNNNDGDKLGFSEYSPGRSFLCSTPELQKHYNQLVGCKEQVWSPKLETISEYKIRYSPCRFIGLEWKEKEV